MLRIIRMWVVYISIVYYMSCGCLFFSESTHINFLSNLILIAVHENTLERLKTMTPTWLEHATFWSGVRRATIAPRSQSGSTEIWTRIAGFKVQSANHYTMEPCLNKPCQKQSQQIRQSTGVTKLLFPAGFEPATLCVWSTRDNHYTKETLDRLSGPLAQLVRASC